MFTKIHISWIFVTLLVGIIAGTILVTIFHSSFATFWWLVLGILLVVLAFLRPNFLMLFLAFLAGVIFAEYRSSQSLIDQKNFASMVGSEIEITGTVSEDPDTDEAKTALKLKVPAGIIYVQLPINKTIKRSDKVTLRGKLLDGFGTFVGNMYRPQIIKIERSNDMLLELRNNFADGIKKYIGEDEAKLGLAYLLGMKSGLSDELVETLQVVGLVHIVVASGTHMSILVGIAKKLFGKISRFAGLFFSMILIIGFGGIVGWTASITRAAIVSGLSISMWYVGRRFEAWRLILLAMAITLMIDPSYLLNLGWLLSFGSFAGILILMPILTRFLYHKRKPNFVAETLLATFSATLMCLPVSLYYFGSVSLISFVANLLILPTMPYVMGMVFATGVVSWWPFVATIIGKLTTFFLDFHLLVIIFFGEQKMFFIKIEPENPWVFLIYLPILTILVYAKIKTWKLGPNRNLSTTEKSWQII